MTNASSEQRREVFLFSYLWDIVDEGPDHFAQRLVEELGVTGVALAVAYHDGRFLLPHHSRRRMYVLEPHVTYFPNDLSLYGDTPLKPTQWSELGDGPGNAFAQTKAALDRAGLELQSWTVYCYNERLGTAHPEYAVENAWGSRYMFGLCPAQEAVRSLRAGIDRGCLPGDGCRFALARVAGLPGLRLLRGRGDHEDHGRPRSSATTIGLALLLSGLPPGRGASRRGRRRRSCDRTGDV